MILTTYNSSQYCRELFSKTLLQSFLHHFAIEWGTYGNHREMIIINPWRMHVQG